jgi:superfamily II DNA or RNA helicase
MKIKVAYNYSFFSTANLSEKRFRAVDKSLSYLTKDAFFVDAYKRHAWDGRKHLLSKVRKGGQLVGYRFPTGLLRKKDIFAVLGEPVLEWAAGITPTELEIPDDEKLSHLLNGITLYDYQIFCLRRMLEQRRGVVQVATAGGKTEIAAAAIRFLNVPTIVMVPTLDLLYQTRERYAARLGLSIDEVGIIGEGQYEPKFITVASVPTLRLMLGRGGKYIDEEAQRLYESTKLIILDEAHMISDNTFYAVFMAFVNAEFRFGMSATPFDREDNSEMMLIGATGTLIARVLPEYLMKRGFIAIPDIVMLKVNKPKLSDAFSYQQAVNFGVVDNGERNQATVDLVKACAKKKVLVIFRYLRHGHLLSRLLYDAGIDHKIVKGEIPGEERERIRHEFEHANLDVIVASVGVFKLGIDLPSIEVLIRCDGGKSKISTIQILGRALRVKGDRRRVKVYDFFDDTQKHLRSHSRKRLRDYKGLGKTINVSQIDLESGQNYLVF